MRTGPAPVGKFSNKGKYMSLFVFTDYDTYIAKTSEYFFSFEHEFIYAKGRV